MARPEWIVFSARKTTFTFWPGKLKTVHMSLLPRAALITNYKMQRNESKYEKKPESSEIVIPNGAGFQITHRQRHLNKYQSRVHAIYR